jgi:hypothetical protein
MSREIATVAPAAPGSSVLVWIDAERAVLARWTGEARIERIDSDVPARHEATGHVRFDPVVRHGGGGAAQDKIARERAGHVRAYIAEVARRIGPEEDVEILGPAGVRDELARSLRAEDGEHGRRRVVVTTPSGRLTEPQLVARLRVRIGEAPPRVRPRRVA